MREKITLIVFSGELDKAVAAFNLALGAAAMGMEVTLFFTFWGLNVLKKDGLRGKKDLIRRLLSLVNRGGVERLPLSRLNMLGLGRRLMKKLMREAKMPSLKEMLSMAKESGVKLVACTTTMEVMGISKEDLIPEVDSFAGVATYLVEAQKGRVNLFI